MPHIICESVFFEWSHNRNLNSRISYAIDSNPTWMHLTSMVYLRFSSFGTYSIFWTRKKQKYFSLWDPLNIGWNRYRNNLGPQKVSFEFWTVQSSSFYQKINQNLSKSGWEYGFTKLKLKVHPFLTTLLIWLVYQSEIIQFTRIELYPIVTKNIYIFLVHIRNPGSRSWVRHFDIFIVMTFFRTSLTSLSLKSFRKYK